MKHAWKSRFAAALAPVLIAGCSNAVIVDGAIPDSTAGDAGCDSATEVSRIDSGDAAATTVTDAAAMDGAAMDAVVDTAVRDTHEDEAIQADQAEDSLLAASDVVADAPALPDGTISWSSNQHAAQVYHQDVLSCALDVARLSCSDSGQFAGDFDFLNSLPPDVPNGTVFRFPTEISVIVVSVGPPYYFYHTFSGTLEYTKINNRSGVMDGTITSDDGDTDNSHDGGTAHLELTFRRVPATTN